MGDVFAVSEGQHLKRHDLISLSFSIRKADSVIRCVSKCVKNINHIDVNRRFNER